VKRTFKPARRLTAAGLRRRMARARLSQEAAADYLGLSVRSVRYYLAGAWPIPRTVELAVRAMVLEHLRVRA